MTRITQHFYIEEFVPKHLIDKYGQRAKWFVSPFQYMIAEMIRREFGNRPMRINDWCFGGRLQNRGTRLPNTKIGSWLSQHKMKCAIDFDIEGIPSPEVNKHIIDKPDIFMKNGITTIEESSYTPSWTHVDCRYTGSKELLIIKP